MPGYQCVPPGGCGQSFRALTMFDAHQSFRGEGPVVCLTPEQMEKKGWLRDGAGCWTETEGAGRGGVRQAAERPLSPEPRSAASGPGGDRRSTPTDCSQTEVEVA